MVASVTGEVLLDGRKIVLKSRALCALEARFGGRPVQEIFQTPSLSVVRSALEVGAGVSEDEAYDLIDKVGFPKVAAAIGEAVAAAFPEADKTENPPKTADASTG